MRTALVLCCLSAGCSADWELPGENGEATAAVQLEPFGTLDAAPPVVRLRVQGAARSSALADFRFFSGTLSSYHLGRIRSGELPNTLLEREIPALVWSEGSDVVVAPALALASGAYGLATPERGLVAELVVDAELAPVLERTWPVRSAASGAGTQLYCGELAAPVEAARVELAPAGVEARLESGLDERGSFSERCVRIEPVGTLREGSLVLAPPLVGSAELEPLPLLIEGRSPLSFPVCPGAELALGPACAEVLDDRVVLRASAGASFWAIEEPAPLLGVVLPGASLVVRGFEPESRTRILGRYYDASGAAEAFDRELMTSTRIPHVVINEVLADPRGPEAQSEWIELANDGSERVNLGGFSLTDSADSVPLPARELAPGETLLLVAEGYAPEAELDLLPAPERVLFLPRLGRAGLTNSGESLRLYDAAGRLLSRWPALPAPAPGISLARRTPEAPDSEMASFARHAPPGASPGAPNVTDPASD